MKTKLSLIILTVISLIFSGCGPSQEEIATMTASAWTPTPPPTVTPTLTPTATPIPYDLTVKVTDAEGNPVASASLTIAGNEAPVLTSESGEATWRNLPAPDGSIEVAAPGYFASSQSFSLSRGPNEVAVVLERDPFGLLPSQACASTETLLYIEDFQDGQAQGWPEIDLHATGWNVNEYPEEPGNFVASNNGSEHIGTTLQGMTFADPVWRLRFRVDGRRAISFNWLQNYGIELEGKQVEDVRYQVVADTDVVGIRRLTLPVLNIEAARGRGAKAGTWHNIEISTFQGMTEVWLDGQRITGYMDPKPLPGGGIGLEIFNFDSSKPDTVINFDNISVCALSTPFTSLYSIP